MFAPKINEAYDTNLYIIYRLANECKKKKRKSRHVFISYFACIFVCFSISLSRSPFLSSMISLLSFLLVLFSSSHSCFLRQMFWCWKSTWNWKYSTCMPNFFVFLALILRMLWIQIESVIRQQRYREFDKTSIYHRILFFACIRRLSTLTRMWLILLLLVFASNRAKIKRWKNDKMMCEKHHKMSHRISWLSF